MNGCSLFYASIHNGLGRKLLRFAHGKVLQLRDFAMKSLTYFFQNPSMCIIGKNFFILNINKAIDFTIEAKKTKDFYYTGALLTLMRNLPKYTEGQID